MKTMKKILMIEDDIELAQSLKLILEDEGYQANWIIDYTTLDDKLANYQPDLILLDYLLPKKDGVAIARLIRGDKLSKNTPIIMVAATEAIKSEALRFGVNEFVEKPFDVYNLLNLICQYSEQTTIRP